MSDGGDGSVTLIFYRLGPLRKEPLLNIVAAACQMSPFSHVEMAIGNAAAKDGSMMNVCRIFNDSVGVELASRTGRNPSYSYVQLGCSKVQEQRMLNFARSCVGKPFSSIGMMRSVLMPRTTTGTDYYCAGKPLS